MKASPAPDPLAALHDIVEPGAAPIWPLGWGWWLVLGLALMLVLLIFWVWRRRRSAVMREALRRIDASAQLAQVEQARVLQQLLRRLAVWRFGDPALASLANPDWVRWLARRPPREHPLDEQQLEAWLALGYGAHPPAAPSPGAMRDYARAWVQRYGPKPLLPWRGEADA